MSDIEFPKRKAFEVESPIWDRRTRLWDSDPARSIFVTLDGKNNNKLTTKEYLDSLNPKSLYHRKLLGNIINLWKPTSVIAEEDLYVDAEGNLVVGWFIVGDDRQQKQLRVIQRWSTYLDCFLWLSSFTAKLSGNKNPFTNLSDEITNIHNAKNRHEEDQMLASLKNNKHFLGILFAILGETTTFPLKFDENNDNPLTCTVSSTAIRIASYYSPAIKNCPTVWMAKLVLSKD